MNSTNKQSGTHGHNWLSLHRITENGISRLRTHMFHFKDDHLLGKWENSVSNYVLYFSRFRMGLEAFQLYFRESPEAGYARGF